MEPFRAGLLPAQCRLDGITEHPLGAIDTLDELDGLAALDVDGGQEFEVLGHWRSLIHGLRRAILASASDIDASHENVGISADFLPEPLVYEHLFDYYGDMSVATLDPETTVVDPVEHAVGLLRDAAQAIRVATMPACDRARALVAARNAIDAHLAEELAEIDATKAHEIEGAASVATWAARELRQDPGTTRQMVRAARTMRDLPSIGVAAHAGRVGLDHVHACTYGLKHVGHDHVTALEPEVLDVAVQHPPRELFTLMRYAKAIIHSDELDQAWLKGMDKEDFRVVRVGDGYQPTGFLGIDLGAKLKVFLDSVSVPRNGDDDRTNAQRRTDGLDELLTTALGDGLPTECSIRPHLSVVVDADTMKDALNRESRNSRQSELLEREPAILEGFGPIGPALLAYIAFGGELTPILVAGFKENRKILDVGRTKRIATKKQRRAIIHRQDGICANRGCHHRVGEIHHITDWLYGGKTNLNYLMGLCRKCHALATLGKLIITGTWNTGYTFTTSRAGPSARTG
jgi:hypothetical protein